MIITSCGNSILIAKQLARKLKVKYSPLKISFFPDGELYLRFKDNVKGKKVVIIHSFQPNSNLSLLKVLFAATTAKDLGAKKIILIAPYLAYLRQDKRFKPGEAISSRVMAKYLNASIDQLITFDPHLHRYRSLDEIFTIPTQKLTANELIADYIQKKFKPVKDIVIVGPDRESYQWAEAIAQKIGAESTILWKKRSSSRKVNVNVVKLVDLKGKHIVIVDDLISTGHTIAEAAKLAKKKGARKITAMAVHGLFAEQGYERLKKAGVQQIITTNCIKHKSNQIEITPLLIKSIR